MKTKPGKLFAVLAVAVILTGASGCQTGWKFSNPFSRSPKASDADAPRELEELDELNEITPPPENYTSNDSASSSEKSASLAQRGKYDAGDDVDVKVALRNDADAPAESREPEAPQDNFRAPDYTQNYRAGETFASNVGSASPALPTSADAQLAASAQPYSVPDAQAPNAQTAQNFAATYDAEFPSVDLAMGSFPTDQRAPAQTSAAQTPVAQAQGFAGRQADYSAGSAAAQLAQNQQSLQPYNPIAQVSGASVQTAPVAQTAPIAQTPATGQATALAYNFDQAPAQQQFAGQQLLQQNAPQNNAISQDSGSDPYSNVFYEPQTTSGGFAPGSVLY